LGRKLWAGNFGQETLGRKLWAGNFGQEVLGRKGTFRVKLQAGNARWESLGQNIWTGNSSLGTLDGKCLVGNIGSHFCDLFLKVENVLFI
jgi:hypothetical protein